MTVLELNEHARGRPEIDAEVDDHLRRLAITPRPVVIDSRMAWFFVPDSYKVFLVVDPRVGAERVHGAGRSDERYGSSSVAEIQGKARERVEAERYRELYGVDRDDWRNYDLVVDTTHAPADQVVDVVLAALDGDGFAAPRPRCFLSPRRLLPSRPFDPTPGIVTAAPGPPVDVVVASGHIVVVDGHRRAAAALAAADPLIECRLIGFEDEPIQGGDSARSFAATHVTPEGVTTWETHHDFAFDTHPAWLGGSGSSATPDRDQPNSSSNA